MQHANLIRKQFMLAGSQVVKLDQIAAEQSASAGEIVRRAIDAYDPSRDWEKETEEILIALEKAVESAGAVVDAACHKIDRMVDDQDRQEKTRKEVVSWAKKHPTEMTALVKLFGVHR